MKVAQLRTDDASVTAGEFAKAGKTMSLIKALFGFPAAANTVDLAAEFEPNRFSQSIIQRNPLVTDAQEITHR